MLHCETSAPRTFPSRPQAIDTARRWNGIEGDMELPGREARDPAFGRAVRGNLPRGLRAGTGVAQGCLRRLRDFPRFARDAAAPRPCPRIAIDAAFTK